MNYIGCYRFSEERVKWYIENGCTLFLRPYLLSDSSHETLKELLKLRLGCGDIYIAIAEEFGVYYILASSSLPELGEVIDGGVVMDLYTIESGGLVKVGY